MRALLVAVTLGASACAVTTTRPADRPATAPTEKKPTEPAPTFRLTMFDVGTGLSVLVDGEDFTLLYDAGSNDDFGGTEETRAAAYLVDTLGPSGPAGCGGSDADHPPKVLSHVFLSHPHKDHLSLFPEVFRCFTVVDVWDSGFPSKAALYEKFLQAAVSSGARLHRAKARRTDRDDPNQALVMRAVPFAEGERVVLGRDASFTVLHVDPDAADENDASIVLQVRLGKKTVLFMGDAEGGARPKPYAAKPPTPKSVEGELLGRWGRALRADVLIVGHHGSMTSSRAAFVDRVAPQIALISSGPYLYGKVQLPDPEVVAALSARARVLTTTRDDEACKQAPDKVGRDADGKPGGCSAITLRFTGNGIDVDSQAKR